MSHPAVNSHTLPIVFKENEYMSLVSSSLNEAVKFNSSAAPCAEVRISNTFDERSRTRRDGLRMDDPSCSSLNPMLFAKTVPDLKFPFLDDSMNSMAIRESYVLDDFQRERLGELLRLACKLKSFEEADKTIQFNPKELLDELQQDGTTSLVGSRVGGVIDRKDQEHSKKDIDFQHSFNAIETMEPEELFDRILVLIGRLIYKKKNIQALSCNNKNILKRLAQSYIVRNDEGKLYKIIKNVQGIHFTLSVDLRSSVPIDISVFNNKKGNPFFSITQTGKIEKITSDNPRFESQINRELFEYFESNRIVIFHPEAENACSRLIKLICPEFNEYQGVFWVLQPGLVKDLFETDTPKNRRQFIANLLNPKMNIHISSLDLENNLTLDLFRLLFQSQIKSENLELYLKEFKDIFTSIEDSEGNALVEEIKDHIIKIFPQQENDFSIKLMESFLERPNEYKKFISKLKKDFSTIGDEKRWSILERDIDDLLKEGFKKSFVIKGPHSKQVRMSIASFLVDEVSNQDFYNQYVDAYLSELFPLFKAEYLIDHWNMTVESIKNEKMNSLKHAMIALNKMLIQLIEYYVKNRPKSETTYFMLQSIFYFVCKDWNTLIKHIEVSNLDTLSLKYYDLLLNISEKIPNKIKMKILMCKIKQNEGVVNNIDLQLLLDIFLCKQKPTSEEEIDFLPGEIITFLWFINRKEQFKSFMQKVIASNCSEELLRFILDKLNHLIFSNSSNKDNKMLLKALYMDSVFLLITDKRAKHEEILEILQFYKEQANWPKYFFVLKSAVEMANNKEKKQHYTALLSEYDSERTFNFKDGAKIGSKITLKDACALAEGLWGFGKIDFDFFIKLCDKLIQTHNSDLALDYIFEFLSTHPINKNVLAILVKLSNTRNFDPDALSFRSQMLLYDIRSNFKTDIKIKILIQKLRQGEKNDITESALDELSELLNIKSSKKKRSVKKIEFSSEILASLKHLILRNLNDERFIPCCKKLLDCFLISDKEGFRIFVDDFTSKSYVSENLLRSLHVKFRNFDKDKEVHDSINKLIVDCINRLIDRESATSEEIMELVKILKTQSRWLKAMDVLTKAICMARTTYIQKKSYLFEKGIIYKKLVASNQVSIDEVLKYVDSCWDKGFFDVSLSIYLTEKFCDNGCHTQALSHLIHLNDYSQNLSDIKSATLKIVNKMDVKIDFSDEQCRFLKSIWEHLERKSKIKILMKDMMKKNKKISSKDLLEIFNLMVEEEKDSATDISNKDLKALKLYVDQIKYDKNIEQCYKKMFLFLEKSDEEASINFAKEFLKKNNIYEALLRFLIERLWCLKKSNKRNHIGLLVEFYEKLIEKNWCNNDDKIDLLGLYEDKKDWVNFINFFEKNMEFFKEVNKTEQFQKYIDKLSMILVRFLDTNNLSLEKAVEFECFFDEKNVSHAPFYLKICFNLFDSGRLDKALCYLKKLEEHHKTFDFKCQSELFDLLLNVYNKKKDEKNYILCFKRRSELESSNLKLKRKLHFLCLSYANNEKNSLDFINKDLLYFFSKFFIQEKPSVLLIEHIFNLHKRNDLPFDFKKKFNDLLKELVGDSKIGLENVLSFIKNTISNSCNVETLALLGEVGKSFDQFSVKKEPGVESRNKSLEYFLCVEYILISFFCALKKYKIGEISEKYLVDFLSYITDILSNSCKDMRKLHSSKKVVFNAKELKVFLIFFVHISKEIQELDFVFSKNNIRRNFCSLLMHLYFMFAYSNFDENIKCYSLVSFDYIATYLIKSLSFYFDKHESGLTSEVSEVKDFLDGVENTASTFLDCKNAFFKKNREISSVVSDSNNANIACMVNDFLLKKNKISIKKINKNIIYKYDYCLLRSVFLSNSDFPLKLHVLDNIILSIMDFYFNFLECNQNDFCQKKSKEILKNLEKDICSIKSASSNFDIKLTHAKYTDTLISLMNAAERRELIFKNPELYYFNAKFLISFLNIFENTKSSLFLKVFSELAKILATGIMIYESKRKILFNYFFRDYMNLIQSFINSGEKYFQLYLDDFKEEEKVKFQYQFLQLISEYCILKLLDSDVENSDEIPWVVNLMRKNFEIMAFLNGKKEDDNFKNHSLYNKIDWIWFDMRYKELYRIFLFLMTPITKKNSDQVKYEFSQYGSLANAEYKKQVQSCFSSYVGSVLNLLSPEFPKDYAKWFICYTDLIFKRLNEYGVQFENLSENDKHARYRSFVKKEMIELFRGFEQKKYSKVFITEIKKNYLSGLQNLSVKLSSLVIDEMLFMISNQIERAKQT